MPQALAAVQRRRSSSIRAWVRATSMPPLWVNTPSSWYCSVLSRVSSIIIFEYSIGKMKLEACPVEPPGFGIGPLSTRTRSRQPSRARWQARLLPTIPAPTITALARAGVSFMPLISCPSVSRPVPRRGRGCLGPATGKLWRRGRALHSGRALLLRPIAAYSTGISLLISPRSMPCLLRTIRAIT